MTTLTDSILTSLTTRKMQKYPYPHAVVSNLLPEDVVGDLKSITKDDFMTESPDDHGFGLNIGRRDSVYSLLERVLHGKKEKYLVKDFPISTLKLNTDDIDNRHGEDKEDIYLVKSQSDNYAVIRGFYVLEKALSSGKKKADVYVIDVSIIYSNDFMCNSYSANELRSRCILSHFSQWSPLTKAFSDKSVVSCIQDMFKVSLIGGYVGVQYNHEDRYYVDNHRSGEDVLSNKLVMLHIYIDDSNDDTSKDLGISLHNRDGKIVRSIPYIDNTALILQPQDHQFSFNSWKRDQSQLIQRRRYLTVHYQTDPYNEDPDIPVYKCDP